MSAQHKLEQAAARLRKQEERNIRVISEAHDAWRRQLDTFTVQKADLLRLLIEAGYAPDNASRIIATGHGPDELTVTVDFC